MHIKVASTAGFCFGVNRAVDMVYELLNKGEKVCTLGPIIHNPQMVNKMAQQGVKIIGDPREIDEDAVLVIRSHGVPKSTMDTINKLNIRCKDATCPFVKKIHKTVSEINKQGNVIFIAGDKNHPEVKGIMGHCNAPFFAFNNSNELLDIIKNNQEITRFKILVVAQTTFSVDEWQQCLKILKDTYENVIVFDTICNTTINRQKEAGELSKKTDVMIVIGGRESSNTAKLFSICNKNCKSYLIEKAEDLQFEHIKDAKFVGVTAGASTPSCIIEEVKFKMEEILKNENNDAGEEMNFEQMLEESLKNLNTDDKVQGVVVGIAPNEVYVDVGRKQAGFIPLAELSNDPNVKPEDVVKVGDTLELLIMKTNDQDGTIMLSKKRIDAMHGFNEIIKANENNTALKGKVIDIIKGGVIAVTDGGTRVFIPASLATASKDDSLEDLKNKEVNFRIIEVNKNRRRAVGSIRSVLNDERKALQKEFWDSLEIGQVRKGKVKSFTSYGAFINLGAIDGMIHISDLSWDKIKHPSEVLKLDEEIEVKIKDFNIENGKISLTYKDENDNPWEKLKNEYPIGTIVDVKIVGMTDFGAFAKILPGIDGLIHISQISENRIEKPQDVLSVGQDVKAKITDIDFDRHRISLSMKALLEKEKDNDRNNNNDDDKNEKIKDIVNANLDNNGNEEENNSIVVEPEDKQDK